MQITEMKDWVDRITEFTRFLFSKVCVVGVICGCYLCSDFARDSITRFAGFQIGEILSLTMPKRNPVNYVILSTQPFHLRYL
jgi:hypothetical protein